MFIVHFIIITSAAPQIVEHQILEVGDHDLQPKARLTLTQLKFEL